MVKTPCFQCKGMGSVPGQGTKILHPTCWQPEKNCQTENLNPGFLAVGAVLFFTSHLTVF